MAIDTSCCVIGELYVYNEKSKTVHCVSTDSIVAYAASNDYLYYVTSEWEIIQADYLGEKQSLVYDTQGGRIHDITVFGNILYFVVDGQQLVFVDIFSGNSQSILVQEELKSVYVYDSDKLIWTNSVNETFYYNTTSGQTIALNNQLDDTFLSSESMFGFGAISAAITADTLSTDDYNDVIFPLEEYPAVAEVKGFKPTVIQSYFWMKMGMRNTMRARINVMGLLSMPMIGFGMWKIGR